MLIWSRGRLEGDGDTRTETSIRQLGLRGEKTGCIPGVGTTPWTEGRRQQAGGQSRESVNFLLQQELPSVARDPCLAQELSQVDWRLPIFVPFLSHLRNEDLSKQQFCLGTIGLLAEPAPTRSLHQFQWVF